MDGLSMLMGRRSIRAYDERPVDEGDIETLLRAAAAAPSAGNQQPWHFVVVTRREGLQALSECTPYGSMLPRAPLAIAVCARTGGLKHDRFWEQDCSAATQNILLAAHAIGLGGVWLGFYPDESRWRAAADALGCPEGIVPFSVIAIGHPAEEKPPANRFDAERVHRERW